MNICLCGTEAGYPHDPLCPYPLYRGSAAQEQDWARARDRAGEVVRNGEFRRAWETLEASGACDSWGGVECRRLWREYLAAGLPDDLPEFIRRRANVTADGSEPTA